MSSVLIADDDVDVRDVVALKLEQSGHEVIAVGDGLSALEAARESRPALAVLDIAMPGMSGLDLCRRLRSDPATAKMPIIMLTARGMERDIEDGRVAGADEYVVKPFSPRDLATRVDALLTRAAEGGWRPAGTPGDGSAEGG